MPRYHLHFGAARDHYPQSTEHTRVLELEHPIEYDSDIVAVQALAAEMVGAKKVMLTSWRELKGVTRPGDDDERDIPDHPRRTLAMAEARFCPALQSEAEGMNATMLEKLDLLQGALDVASMHEFAAELLGLIGRCLEIGAPGPAVNYLRDAASALHSAKRRLG